MNDNIVNELQLQMNRERQNAQVYLYIASVFENLAYDGFAKFFRKQAQEELSHAEKFSRFLISKRIQPRYIMLGSVQVENSISVMALYARDLEVETTDNLKSLYEIADGEDPQVCALLDWFLLEQIEEESWSQDLYDLISRSDCSSTILMLSEKYGQL